MKLLNAEDFIKLLGVTPAEFSRMEIKREIPQANYIVGEARIHIWEYGNINNFFKSKCRNPNVILQKERIKSW